MLNGTTGSGNGLGTPSSPPSQKYEKGLEETILSPSEKSKMDDEEKIRNPLLQRNRSMAMLIKQADGLKRISLGKDLDILSVSFTSSGLGGRNPFTERSSDEEEDEDAP